MKINVYTLGVDIVLSCGLPALLVLEPSEMVLEQIAMALEEGGHKYETKKLRAHIAKGRSKRGRPLAVLLKARRPARARNLAAIVEVRVDHLVAPGEYVMRADTPETITLRRAKDD